MNGDLAQTQLRQHEHYEIRIKGQLDEHWSEWFDDLTITYDEDDNTIMAGPLADQSALYGLLKKVHDLGLPLISVSQVEPSALAKRQTESRKEERNDRRTDA